MIGSTHIHALTARYVVPRSASQAAPRLDRLLRRVLDEALEPALLRAGVPVDATVCVRSVTHRVALSTDASDDALVLAWSVDLSGAIARAVARGDADVAVFTSPHHALAALADDIATADLTRAWVWRRLGFGDLTHAGASGRADLLARALARSPAAVIPVLEHLAARGRLAPLVTAWLPAHWDALARVAARHHGLDAAALLAAPSPAPQDTSAPVSPPLTHDTSRPASQHVPQDITQHAHSSVLPDTSPRAPQPVPSDTSFPDLDAAVGALARALLAARAALSPAARRPAALLAALADEPAGLARLTRRIDALARDLAPTTRVPPLDAASPATAVELGTRPTGDTDFGGLLFLVHLFAALGLPATLAADPVFAARSTRWVLHRLALALIPAASTDPAALAFAGLPPDATPPSRGEPPPTPQEADRLADLARQFGETLHHRLADPARAPAALLDWVCRRPARIVADPGWLAVHLSLRSVDTRLRRAGLDLDPDFVPWLGVVLKFHYA